MFHFFVENFKIEAGMFREICRYRGIYSKRIPGNHRKGRRNGFFERKLYKFFLRQKQLSRFR